MPSDVHLGPSRITPAEEPQGRRRTLAALARTGLIKFDTEGRSEAGSAAGARPTDKGARAVAVGVTAAAR